MKTVEELKKELLQGLKDDLNAVTGNEIQNLVNEYIETAFEHGFESGYERGYLDCGEEEQPDLKGG
jgi:hypothetical protein